MWALHARSEIARLQSELAQLRRETGHGAPSSSRRAAQSPGGGGGGSGVEGNYASGRGASPRIAAGQGRSSNEPFMFAPHMTGPINGSTTTVEGEGLVIVPLIPPKTPSRPVHSGTSGLAKTPVRTPTYGTDPSTRGV